MANYIESIRLASHLLKVIQKNNIETIRFASHLLKEILKNCIETIKFASHLLEAIQKNYMGTFIWRETIRNSSKFQHRIVYIGASIIRRFNSKWNLESQGRLKIVGFNQNV